MPSFKSKVEFDDVCALKDSGLALLCEIDGAEVWIPQSQVDDDSEVYREGDTGTLVISEWFARQKKLI